jgi:hypothetical protein
MGKILALIQAAPLKYHVGSAVISFISSLVGTFGVYFVAGLSFMVVGMHTVELLLFLAGLLFFEDWTQFKGVCITSSPFAIGGTAAAIAVLGVM